MCHRFEMTVFFIYDLACAVVLLRIVISKDLALFMFRAATVIVKWLKYQVVATLNHCLSCFETSARNSFHLQSLKQQILVHWVSALRGENGSFHFLIEVNIYGQLGPHGTCGCVQVHALKNYVSC